MGFAKRRILSLFPLVIACILMISAMFSNPAFADEASAAGSGTMRSSGIMQTESISHNAETDDYVLHPADDSAIGPVTMIRIPFEIPLKEGLFQWDFPYSDGFFSILPDTFSKTFAQGSLGLAMSAFRMEDPSREHPYKKYLSGAGRGPYFRDPDDGHERAG